MAAVEDYLYHLPPAQWCRSLLSIGEDNLQFYPNFSLFSTLGGMNLDHDFVQIWKFRLRPKKSLHGTLFSPIFAQIYTYSNYWGGYSQIIGGISPPCFGTPADLFVWTDGSIPTNFGSGGAGVLFYATSARTQHHFPSPTVQFHPALAQRSQSVMPLDRASNITPLAHLCPWLSLQTPSPPSPF